MADPTPFTPVAIKNAYEQAESAAYVSKIQTLADQVAYWRSQYNTPAERDGGDQIIARNITSLQYQLADADTQYQLAQHRWVGSSHFGTSSVGGGNTVAGQGNGSVGAPVGQNPADPSGLAVGTYSKSGTGQVWSGTGWTSQGNVSSADIAAANPTASTPTFGAPIDTIRSDVVDGVYQITGAKSAGQSDFSPVSNFDSSFGTAYTPYGNQKQIELLNTRTLIDKTSGEIGYYQVPINPDTGLPRTGIYGAEAGGMLIGGGSRNAAQSGMFNQGVAGTPDIVTQWNPTQYAETANVAKANAIRANPTAYSILGAEAYFGQVAPLDGRVLTPDMQMSRYPAWTGNLANLAQQVAPSKADYAGANIPWSIPLNSPYISYMDTQGLGGKAPNAYDWTASMSYKGELYGVGSRVGKMSNPTPEPITFIATGTGGRYGLASEFFGEKYTPKDIYKSYGWGGTPTTVGVGDKKGGNPAQVAASMEAAGYAVPSVAVSGTPFTPTFTPAPPPTPAIQPPFTSIDRLTGTPKGTITTETKPSENWWQGIPLVGGAIPGGVLPGTSQMGIGKGFATWLAPTETTTTKQLPSVVMNRSDLPKEGGADYTGMFVVNGKPSTLLTEPVGNPYALNGQMVQDYQTTDIGKVNVARSSSVVSVGGSPAMTGYAGVTNTLTGWMPSSPAGEKAMQIAGLATPLTMQSSMVSLISGNKNAEMFEPMRGQYTQFKENPLMSVGSLAIGGVFGTGLRAAAPVYGAIKATAGTGRVATASARFIENAAPKLFMGIYGADIAARSTGYGTDISYESVGRAKGIVLQEAVPFGVGMGLGYAAPDSAINAINTAKIDYRSMVQEGQVTGKLDYISFKGKKSAMEIDWYLREKVFENPRVQAYADNPLGMANIDIRSAWQERGATPQKPITTIKPTTPDFSPAYQQPATRMTTKTVGGRVTSGLRPERSMGSGMRDVPTESVGTKTSIGSRTDYRNLPRTSEQPYTRMQSQSQMFVSEQLPVVEGMTRGQVSQPRQMPQSQMFAPQQLMQPQARGAIQVVEPELMFGQKSNTKQQSVLRVDVMQDFGVSKTSRQAQEQQFVQQSARISRTEQAMRVAPVSVVGQGSRVSFGQRFSQSTIPQTASGIRSTTASKSMFDTVFDQSTRTTQRTTPITTPRQTPWQEPIQPKIPKPIIPGIPGGPGFPGGGGGQTPFGSKRTAAYQKTSALGLDMSVRGFSTPKSQPLRMPMNVGSSMRNPFGSLKRFKMWG